jgi:hypothetical protein
MPGVNLKYKNRMALRAKFWNYLSRTAGGANRLGRPKRSKPTFLFKNGVPATNTAADAPDRKNQICIDLANDDVYLCTAYTNATTHTWLKISD